MNKNNTIVFKITKTADLETLRQHSKSLENEVCWKFFGEYYTGNTLIKRESFDRPIIIYMQSKIILKIDKRATNVELIKCISVDELLCLLK